MWFSSLFSILFWLGNVVLVVLLSSCFSHFPPRGCHLRVRVVFAVELMHHILTFFGCAAKKKRRHDLCVHCHECFLHRSFTSLCTHRGRLASAVWVACGLVGGPRAR